MNIVEPLLKGYKAMVTPYLGGRCRYVPSCSEYAAEAVAKWGPVRGCLLALGRILRCNPFSRGGYDPPPQLQRTPNTGSSNLDSSPGSLDLGSVKKSYNFREEAPLPRSVH